MITFNELGSYGRLGNQLFQIAATIGIAKSHNFTYGFPNWQYNQYLSNPLPSNIHMVVEHNYLEASHEFHSININDNTNLKGFFQRESYFKHVKQDVISTLSFSHEVKSFCAGYLGSFKGTSTVAVHVRRTDYTSYPDNFVNQPVEYYLKAMDIISNKVQQPLSYLFFSDDMEWCKQNFNADNFYFVELNKPDIFDICTMSMCNHHIIANSSFSWWGAYLSNSNGIVICPENWFGHLSGHSSVALPEWIHI